MTVMMMMMVVGASSSEEDTATNNKATQHQFTWSIAGFLSSVTHSVFTISSVHESITMFLRERALTRLSLLYATV